MFVNFQNLQIINYEHCKRESHYGGIPIVKKSPIVSIFLGNENKVSIEYKYVTKIFFGFFFFAKIVAANFNSLPNKLNFCCRNYVRKYGRHIVQKVHIIDVTKKMWYQMLESLWIYVLRAVLLPFLSTNAQESTARRWCHRQCHQRLWSHQRSSAFQRTP